MLWIKAFHIIAMICWFSGLFYLPRLFVYHCMSQDKISIERFKIMERKLYRGITTPSMIVTVILGGWLLIKSPLHWQQQWFHFKLVLVAGLIIYHFYCGYLVTVFAKDRNIYSHVFYRILNEIPVFFLIAIILLIEIKPHI